MMLCLTNCRILKEKILDNTGLDDLKGLEMSPFFALVGNKNSATYTDTI